MPNKKPKYDIVIDEDGMLMALNTIGKLVHKKCPFATQPNPDKTAVFCGDWCPHFSVHRDHIDHTKYSSIIVRLCKGKEILTTEDGIFIHGDNPDGIGKPKRAS